MKKFNFKLKTYISIIILGLAYFLPVLAQEVLNPVGTTNPNLIIGNALRAVLGVTGAIALFMFVYGGIILLTSRGNDQSVTKGKNILIWATIGIAVIFSSFALVEFVIRGITG